MIQYYPLHSLIHGSWFKLICGASYQHLQWVRNLALAYSLAGADCIDVAADAAVIAAAQEGIRVAQKLKQKTKLIKSNDVPKQDFQRLNFHLPWLMVSINDGEDPHFRKAEFDLNQCPPSCLRPCEQVCPADAIDIKTIGVIDELCYGCGRCLPICPEQLVTTRSYVSSPQEIVSLIQSMTIDGIEIHTQVGHYENFKNLWQEIRPVVSQLKLLAISCTEGQNTVDYLRSLYELISPLNCPLIWQTDGRSMSGDIGKGTTHATIAFAEKVLQANLPGYVQLAGGTNDHTVKKLQRSQMLRQQNQHHQTKFISGVAYGSYARNILSPILEQLETTELQTQPNFSPSQPMKQLNLKLEQDSDLLQQAVSIASQLVNQIKSNNYNN